MASYLDNRPGPSEEFAAEIAAKRVAKELTPEQVEAQAEKAARIEAALAEQALIDSGDPAAVARQEARRAEREAASQRAQEEFELEQARDRSPFADY